MNSHTTYLVPCYHYYDCFFAHLLILQYPDGHHQNLDQ